MRQGFDDGRMPVPLVDGGVGRQEIQILLACGEREGGEGGNNMSARYLVPGSKKSWTRRSGDVVFTVQVPHVHSFRTVQDHRQGVVVVGTVFGLQRYHVSGRS